MKKSILSIFVTLATVFSFSFVAWAGPYRGDFINNLSCLNEFKPELWNMPDVIALSANTGDKDAVILFPNITKLSKPLYLSADKVGYLMSDDTNYDFQKEGVRVESGSCAFPGGTIAPKPKLVSGVLVPGDCAELKVGDHYDDSTNKVAKSFLIKVIRDLTTRAEEANKRMLSAATLGEPVAPSSMNLLDRHARMLEACASYQKDSEVLKAIQASMSKLGLKSKALPKAKPAEKAGAAS